MTNNILQRRYLLAGIATITVLGPIGGLRAQSPPAPFSPEQLDQMLAPVALYPDALLSQVLMAATYPMEVVEAARWSRANPGLRGNDAMNAVSAMDWDVSVKSLVAFPQVLNQMDSHLDWTQNLGDAELAQPGDVSDSIQRLRARAADAGRLTNVPYETVQYLGTGPDRYVVIEPADPNLFYVPYYNPVWAYGVWPYPAYPPFYYPPLAAFGYTVLAVGFMFGIGIAASRCLYGSWRWGRGDWGRGAGYIDINVNRVVNIDPHFDVARINNNHGAWQHDPEHRRGVAYRDVATRERLQPQPGAAQRQQFRGRVEGTPPSGQHPLPNARIETPRGPQVNAQPPPRQPQVNATPPRSTPGGSNPPRPQFQPQVTSRPQYQGTPPAPRGPAINGVERGAQINRESQHGNQVMQHMAQPAPAAPRPSSPPPPRPAPQPPKGGKR